MYYQRRHPLLVITFIIATQLLYTCNSYHRNHSNNHCWCRPQHSSSAAFLRCYNNHRCLHLKLFSFSVLVDVTFFVIVLLDSWKGFRLPSDCPRFQHVKVARSELFPDVPLPVRWGDSGYGRSDGHCSDRWKPRGRHHKVSIGNNIILLNISNLNRD